MLQIVGDHPNIMSLALDDVFLHADEGGAIAKSLLSGLEDGRFHARSRTSLPTHFVCLIQDYMNRGTVQTWMDEDRLSPEGMLAVMQQVASALAHIHKSGLSHNDIKPQNLLLTKLDKGDDGAEVIVKVGDLGIASRSSNHSKDLSQFGMTVFCMATGTKFGSQKFRPDLVDDFVNTLKELTGGLKDSVASLPCAAAAAEGTGMAQRRVDTALASLPDIARCIWDGRIAMADVRDFPCLQGWRLLEEVTAM
jgi:serine/threonine protein kinase